MPIIASAKKKLRQDKKRTDQNRELKLNLKSLLKKATKAKTEKAVRAFFTAADKAAKKNIIHKNKAARLKSRVALLLVKKTEKTEKAVEKAPVKKTKKTASK